MEPAHVRKSSRGDPLIGPYLFHVKDYPDVHLSIE
jgi:hypothetical protein